MTAVLDCPQCGAPLSFEPKPGDETVECSYCHGTVIIPKDLRIKKPKTVVDQRPPEQPKSRNWVVTTFAWIGFVAVFMIFLAIVIPSDQPTDDNPTETPFLDSKSATLEAKATVDALQPLLKQEQGWPANFTEKFLDNSHAWQTGDVRDSYITGNRSISDETYAWNVTSVKSAFDYSYPDIPAQKDFYASVDMKLINMPDDPDADAGLVFRYNGTDRTWYYFSVNDSGQYYFGWYNGKEWSSLIPETDSDAIHPGQTNRLTVGVQGSQFIFLINGQMVDHFMDDHLKSGNLGVAVNLPQENEKASITFANFTVLSPVLNP